MCLSSDFPTALLRTTAAKLLTVWFLAVLVTASFAQGESTSPVWSFSGGRNASIVSSPAIDANRTIYIGVTNANAGAATGLLMAVLPNGTNKWDNLPNKGFFIQRPGIDSGFESSPSLSPDGNTVYIGCNNGDLYAVNAADGTLKWTFQTGPDHAIFSSPVVGRNGMIYIGSTNLDAPADSTFYAVSPEGKQIWFNSIGDEMEASPVIGNNGLIYYAALNGMLHAVSTVDGAEKWRFQLNGDVFATPAIGGDGTVYIGSDARELYALTPEEGHIKWQFPASPGAGITLGVDSTLYVGSVETTTTGKLYAIDSSGKLKPGWPLSFAGRILSVPALRTDGTLIFGCEDDHLYAINSDATVKWAATLDDDVDSSPAIDTDGSIYVGSLGGKLYKFTGNGTPLSRYSAWPMFNHDLAHTGVSSVPVRGGQLINLSTRGPAGPGIDLIAGVVLGGPNAKRLLIRGVGPTLANYGVSAPLPDPALRVHFGSPEVTVPNSDWWRDPDAVGIAQTAAQVGAFPLPDGSRDAAKLMTVTSANSYTTTIESADGQLGIAMAEIYDGDSGNPSTRLINLSARGRVGTGDDVLIAGLVIGGSGQLRVLVRAIGPGQIPFGVTGVLAQPTIAVFSGQREIGRNTGWTSEGLKGDIAGAAALAGAFPLTPADSSIILTLDPGAYTCQVSGVGGSTGVAMVEVYALPF